MKKLLLLAMVLGLLICASHSLGRNELYFLPLRDGNLYTDDWIPITKEYKTPEVCGSYKKGEVYRIEKSLGNYGLYDSDGKRLGNIKEEDIQEFNKLTGFLNLELIYASDGDEAKLLQKEKIEAYRKDKEENARWQKIWKEEENRKIALAQKEQALEVARRKKEAEIRKARIAQFPIEIQDAINKKSVLIGMTQEQARLAWGNPEKINRTITKWGVDEQWVYGRHNYLYFENGILTAIQN